MGSLIGYEHDQSITINSFKLAHYSLEPTNPLSFLANWDGARYISIAVHGYSNSFLTGFFPLYPLLIAIFHLVISSPLTSALLVSWLSLIGAIYFYLKLIKLLFNISNNGEALKASLLFILFPSGVYLLAAYSESLFALISLAAIYFALQKKYLATGLSALLATSARIDGVFVLLLVLLILIEEREKLSRISITLILGSLGTLSYMGYLLFSKHNPLAFIKAQEAHHWFQYSLLTKLSSFGWIDYIFFLAIIWATVYWWKRRKSFSIYMALFLAIPIIGGQFGGYPRYALMAFPLQFMLFDYCKHKTLYLQLLIAIFSVAWSYILLQFAAGYIIS